MQTIVLSHRQKLTADLEDLNRPSVRVCETGRMFPTMALGIFTCILNLAVALSKN